MFYSASGIQLSGLQSKFSFLIQFREKIFSK